jgi:hypothetical protein
MSESEDREGSDSVRSAVLQDAHSLQGLSSQIRSPLSARISMSNKHQAKKLCKVPVVYSWVCWSGSWVGDR